MQECLCGAQRQVRLFQEEEMMTNPAIATLVNPKSVRGFADGE